MQLKAALSSSPVLALPDFDTPFIVETDASNTGIGAVLMQNNHPISYISRALGPHHQALSVYEKELLAVVHAVQAWSSYLTHRPFIIRTDQKSLKYLLEQKIIEELIADPASHPSYSYTNSELRCKGRLVMGNDPTTKLKIFQWLHDSSLGGHSGRDATLHRIKALFFWPRMTVEVQNYVRNCSICQQNKYDLATKPGLLQPLPIPVGVWESVSLDFIEGLPPSFGKHCILVVIDRLSKNAHFLALAHPYTALDVAQLYLDHVFKLHAILERKMVNRHNKAATKVLVQWKGDTPDHATWEFYTDFVAKYPAFHP
ncbi:hypothetical protein V2J09_008402 [Rumex salicifolius]